MSQASTLLSLMITAVRKTARKLGRDFGELRNLQTSVKEPSDFVERAHQGAEKILHQELATARPGYGFLLQKGGEIQGSDTTHRFLGEVLGGSLNFQHGCTPFTLSLALEREGEVIAGVIYDPVSDEIFSAEKGRGAFMNDHRLRVAARRSLRHALLATTIPEQGAPHQAVFLTKLYGLMPVVAGIRSSGCTALDLAYVAAGRYDAYFGQNLKPWTMAAGLVLLREAGGLLVDSDEETSSPLETGRLLAGNGMLMPHLTDVIRTSLPS